MPKKWGLAGRPAHLSSSEKVKVDMINLLATVVINVENKAIAVIVHAEIFGNIFSTQGYLSEELGIVIVRVVDSVDVLFGDNKDMFRRLRINITERKQGIILKDNISRDLAFNNFTK